jgi:broad specificity phosphatase PhoE
MAVVHLVRHGRAVAGWDRNADPGLDGVGARQAEVVADRLAPLGAAGSLSIVTSPMRRCQETAAPLARRWGVTPSVEDSVSEIPSPLGVAMEERVDWLRAAMSGTWRDLGDRYTRFRDSVVAFVATCAEDTVVFSHFIAINAVLGACLDDDRLVIRRLDNTSVTIVEVRDGSLSLVEGGHEADTLIR